MVTSYSYSLTLNDGEIITLAAAIELLIVRCDRELKNGHCTPFLAWRADAKEIQARLNNKVWQTSIPPFDSDFDWRAISGRSQLGADNDPVV